MYYSFDILLAGCAQRGAAGADIVVCPDLRGFHYRDLKRVDELVSCGEQATRPMIADLKRRLGDVEGVAVTPAEG